MAPVAKHHPSDILLDEPHRLALAAWLATRPFIPGIDPEVFRGLITGTRAVLAVKDLLAIIEQCGAGVLDVIDRADLGTAARPHKVLRRFDPGRRQ